MTGLPPMGSGTPPDCPSKLKHIGPHVQHLADAFTGELRKLEATLQNASGGIQFLEAHGFPGLRANIEAVQGGLHQLISRAQSVISEAEQYVHDMVLSPDITDKSANSWSGDLTNWLTTVSNECSDQVKLALDHWTGTAASDFSIYTSDLLSYLQGTATAASTVGGALSDIAKQLRNMQTSIIVDSAHTVIDAVDGALQTFNTNVQSINLQHLIEWATAPVPVVDLFAVWAAVQTISAAVSSAEHAMAAIEKDMIDLAGNVRTALNGMEQDADTMKNALAKVPHIQQWPAEPRLSC